MGLRRTSPGLNIPNTSKPSLRTVRSEKIEFQNIFGSFEEIKTDREEILNCQKHQVCSSQMQFHYVSRSSNVRYKVFKYLVKLPYCSLSECYKSVNSVDTMSTNYSISTTIKVLSLIDYHVDTV